MPREVLQPPHTSQLPSAPDLSLDGANAWTYGVSTRLMSDPGRWDLYNLVVDGLEWLDEYWEEIQDQYINKNEEERGEVDFTELVKTPGRNKTANKTQAQSVMNAEKLARINALHFGALESKNSTNIIPSTTKTTTRLARNEERNPFNPHPQTLDEHVILHEAPTPNPAPKRASTQPLPTAPSFSSTQPPFTAQVVSAPPTGQIPTVDPVPVQQQRFGPRPLPTVPGGMRSRQASTTSLVGGPLPSFNPQRMSTQLQPLIFPSVESSATIVPSMMTKTRARTPPAQEEEPMELDVPLNDEVPKSSNFPSALNRKPSFAALPDPSPLKKSTKIAPTKSIGGKTPSAGERERVDSIVTKEKVRASSGWFNRTKSIATPGGGVTPSTSSEQLTVKTGDPVTALNTAKNAAPVTGRSHTPTSTTPPVVSSSGTNGAATSNGSLKRKSDAITGSPQKSNSSVPKERETKKAKIVAKSAREEEDSLLSLANGGAAAQKPEKSLDGDDIAGRLLKLRKTLSKVVPEGADAGSQPRSRVTSDATMEDRPLSRNDRPDSRSEKARPDSRATEFTGSYKTASERTSSATTDPDLHEEEDQESGMGRVSHYTSATHSTERTRVDSGRLSVKDLSGKERDLREVSQKAVKETTKETKATKAEKVKTNSKATKPAKPVEEKEPTEVKKTIEERKEAFSRPSFGNGWTKATGIPTSNTFGEKTAASTVSFGTAASKLPTTATFGVPPPSTIDVRLNLAASTTPPGSPLPSAKAALKGVPTFKPVKPKEDVFKFKPPIFSAPKPATSKPPGPIFSAPKKQREPESQESETQSTEVDSLFERKLTKQGSLETFSQPTQYSQDTISSKKSGESNPTKTPRDETKFTWRDYDDAQTGDWQAKDEDAASDRNGDMDQEDDEWDGNEEDVTNHRWAAIKAQAEAEAEEEARQRAEAIQEEVEEMEVEDAEDEEPISPTDDPINDNDEGDDENEEAEELMEEDDLPEDKPATTGGGGFLAQIGGMASKALGGGLKSLRMAADAREKEKSEKEKKEARMKEMEARRAAVLAKKAEDEAKRREEIEKKRKAEEEKRKKEKEPLSKSLKKPQIPSSGEKPILKKVPSKPVLASSTIKTQPIASGSKRAPTPTQAPTIKLIGSSKEANASTSSLLPIPSGSTLAANSTLTSVSASTLTSILGGGAKAGGKVTFKPTSAVPRPAPVASTSNLMGAKMEVKKVVVEEKRVSEGGIDENADLPDIKSEYSDSEDESRPRTYDPPGWAQSPDLRAALEGMRGINPDTIFGPMPSTLAMEEIFPGRRKSKFRNRTSSANWAGTDGVTQEEMEEYARRMGFEN